MSTQLSREELFRKAKEMRKQEKLDEATRASFSGEDYEGVVYTSLPTTNMKIMRILGNPLAVRSKPSDPKLSLISMILGDNGKKFRCIWPLKEEQPNWILWKILDLVLDGDWEKGEDGKNNKIFTYAKSHPECFRRVAKNNSDNKFETGWYPRRFVNMNIIDRHDKDFHEENKHSKLLSKKASEIADTGKFWYDPGIPQMAYNVIWDDVVEFSSGPWDTYDIGLKKETDMPWYRAFHGVEDRKKIAQIDNNLVDFIVEGGLTEDERNYKLYDLDALFRVTSYSKIKNRLGDFIKKVDIDFKKNFYEELEELVKVEVEEAKKRREAGGVVQEDLDDDVDYQPDADLSEEVIEEEKVTKKEDPTPTLRSRVVAEKKSEIDWTGLADGSFNGKKYLGVIKMTEEEKGMVLGVKEDGQFSYVKEYQGRKVELMNNPTSDFISPEQFHVDPLSGDEF